MSGTENTNPSLLPVTGEWIATRGNEYTPPERKIVWTWSDALDSALPLKGYWEQAEGSPWEESKWRDLKHHEIKVSHWYMADQVPAEPPPSPTD